MNLVDSIIENWDSVVSASTEHDKVNALHDPVNSIREKHCPLQPRESRQTPIDDRSNTKTNQSEIKYKSYKFIRALVQRRIRASKRSYVNETMNKNTDTKTWWNTVKKITNQAKDNSMPNSTIIDGTKLSPSEFSNQINVFYIKLGGTALPSTVDNNT